jgi:hypothetical protein
LIGLSPNVRQGQGTFIGLADFRKAGASSWQAPGARAGEFCNPASQIS